jgi:hypothetical protein
MIRYIIAFLNVFIPPISGINLITNKEKFDSEMQLGGAIGSVLGPAIAAAIIYYSVGFAAFLSPFLALGPGLGIVAAYAFFVGCSMLGKAMGFFIGSEFTLPDKPRSRWKELNAALKFGLGINIPGEEIYKFFPRPQVANREDQYFVFLRTLKELDKANYLSAELRGSIWSQAEKSAVSQDGLNSGIVDYPLLLPNLQLRNLMAIHYGDFSEIFITHVFLRNAGASQETINSYYSLISNSPDKIYSISKLFIAFHNNDDIPGRYNPNADDCKLIMQADPAKIDVVTNIIHNLNFSRTNPDPSPLTDPEIYQLLIRNNAHADEIHNTLFRPINRDGGLVLKYSRSGDPRNNDYISMDDINYFTRSTRGLHLIIKAIIKGGELIPKIAQAMSLLVANSMEITEQRVNLLSNNSCQILDSFPLLVSFALYNESKADGIFNDLNKLGNQGLPVAKIIETIFTRKIFDSTSDGHLYFPKQKYYKWLCSIPKFASNILKSLERLPNPEYQRLIVLYDQLLPETLEENTLYFTVTPPTKNEKILTLSETKKFNFTLYSRHEQFPKLDSELHPKIVQSFDLHGICAGVQQRMVLANKDLIMRILGLYRGAQADEIIQHAVDSQAMHSLLMGLHPRVGGGKPKPKEEKNIVASTESLEPTKPSSLQVIRDSAIGGDIMLKVAPFINYLLGFKGKELVYDDPVTSSSDTVGKAPRETKLREPGAFPNKGEIDEDALDQEDYNSAQVLR